jgi:hypothetical protein
MVAHCMKRTSETVYLQSLVQESYENAESIKEKVQIKKKSKIIPGDYSYYIQHSALFFYFVILHTTYHFYLLHSALFFYFLKHSTLIKCRCCCECIGFVMVYWIQSYDREL